MNFSKSKKNFSDARNNFSQDGFDFPEAENNFCETKKYFSNGKKNLSEGKNNFSRSENGFSGPRSRFTECKFNTCPLNLDLVRLPDQAEARGISPIASFKKADQLWLAQVVVFVRHRKVEI
jgi:hypothetical protein